jgi:uncharacterized OB-fold protein
MIFDSTPQRPVPQLTPESAPFWKGAQEHRLLIQRCADCQQINWLPRMCCAYCASRNLEWEDASGRGTLESYSVVHVAIDKAWADLVPYVLATVKLEEGIRMVTRLLIDPAKTPKIDGPVRVVFAPMAEGFDAPFWEEVE